MQHLLEILADSAPHGQVASSAESMPFWDAFSIVFTVVGLGILAVWLLKFDGFGALKKAPVRRTRMTPFLPLALIGTWFVLMAGVSGIIQLAFSEAGDFELEIWTYAATGLLEAGLVVAMLFLAHHMFARRVRGFGLDWRTLSGDTAAAVINLLGTYSLVLLALWTVLALGRFMDGDFDLQRHESLTLLARDDGLLLKISAVFFAVLIAPVFEELLFRGFVQTGLRSAGASGWTAIIATSVFFAVIHFPNYTHMLPLFFLSCGMGYAYERGGSLFRPILMHVLFNSLSVITTLLLPSAI